MALTNIESKSKTREKKSYHNQLPTFYRERIRAKVEAFSQFSFLKATPEKFHLNSLKALQLKSTWCAPSREEAAWVVEEILNQESCAV